MLDLSDQPTTPLPSGELQRCYLEQVKRNTERTPLKVIPTGLISPKAPLAEIYIPPRFYANRARVDFPVPDQELDRYRESLKRGILSLDLERVVLEAEKNWQYDLKASHPVGLDVVWEQLNSHHVVVIQGYPGMGKSTLMERLALHMAVRGLGLPDPDMPEHEKLTPNLIPVMLRLGQYANEAFPQKSTSVGMGVDGKSKEGQAKEVLSLLIYLLRKMANMDLPSLADFMRQKLHDGACLVLLDGLDEVSDPVQREEVQEEIKRFVKGYCSRCYFIITSRVAGYDQAAFPDYPHFTLAALGYKEIKYFLPRWCQANREGEFHVSEVSSAQIEEEVKVRAQELQAAIESNEEVRKLAENPLMLTLLLVMQQNRIALPRQRVELYDTITKILLNKSEITESQAIECLGPLAFEMQEANSDFVRQSEVERRLMEVIGRKSDTDDKVRAEAIQFLWRVRVRGGLFVSRVSDYLGFMHRTFQEYFAARHIINTMQTDQDRRINELVQLACRQDALWREPFLLAVAYLSYHNDEHIASAILRVLLVESANRTLEQQVSALVLATEAIIEARPLTIQQELQTQTAELLLTCYERTSRTPDNASTASKKIENVILRWLLSLPKEAYRLPLLRVISQAIKDTQQTNRQRNVLTLLTIIAKQLEPCSPVVFAALIPPLLALTGLPAIGPYKPSVDLTVSADFDVADLALSALSFLGKRGPSGLYLVTVQQYFKEHPEQFRLLARCSLECGTLITPVIIPLSEKNYQQHVTAIRQWMGLSRDCTDENIDAWLSIEQALLECAEGVRYPAAMHLLEMLRCTGKQGGQPWSEIWQTYLQEQLNTANYINYQEVALLWNHLFWRQSQPLADTILKHYTSYNKTKARYACRFIAYLIGNARHFRYFAEAGDQKCTLTYRRLGDLSKLRGITEYFTDYRNFIYLKRFRELLHYGEFDYLEYLIGSWYAERLSCLESLVFTKDLIRTAQNRLRVSARAEKIDNLTILREWLLEVQANLDLEKGNEDEIRTIAYTAVHEIKNTKNDKIVQKAALYILQALPAHTHAGIVLIGEILDGTQNQQIWNACVHSLRSADPIDKAARQALEKVRKRLKRGSATSKRSF
ncbi:hypothetical protein KTT_54950 [Tengunoibacter tsumagoiensis]|uniref:NACHT domain-containing protein n=2 Tax=Tengunoibacter tsumagoiensis TaxID=2014871 RepID=A0A402A9F8_9CHLR|nr:hypothetical protein KTT_54950 [Tengunoibacter tsumagoiensis]